VVVPETATTWAAAVGVGDAGAALEVGVAFGVGVAMLPPRIGCTGAAEPPHAFSVPAAAKARSAVRSAAGMFTKRS